MDYRCTDDHLALRYHASAKGVCADIKSIARELGFSTYIARILFRKIELVTSANLTCTREIRSVED